MPETKPARQSKPADGPTTPEDLEAADVTNTTEPGADGSPVPPVPDDDQRDRVAMTSLRADGTPDQTPDHEVLAAGGDASAAERRTAPRRHLAEQNTAPPQGERR